MNRSLDTRIQKLESDRGIREARFFIIEGNTEGELQAHIDELIRSGAATESDTFVCTGVPRSVGGMNGNEDAP